MDIEQIKEDIEDIQIKADEMGFQGQNETDLWVRDEIADYVFKLVDNLPKQIVSEWRYLADELPKSEGMYEVLCADGSTIRSSYLSVGHDEPICFSNTKSKIVAFR